MMNFIACILHRILLGYLIKEVDVGGTCCTHGGGVYRVLVGKPEYKTPLGRCRRRWEDNFKLDLRDIGIDGAN
jgi:hypothetical protein